MQPAFGDHSSHLSGLTLPGAAWLSAHRAQAEGLCPLEPKYLLPEVAALLERKCRWLKLALQLLMAGLQPACPGFSAQHSEESQFKALQVTEPLLRPAIMNTKERILVSTALQQTPQDKPRQWLYPLLLALLPLCEGEGSHNQAAGCGERQLWLCAVWRGTDPGVRGTDPRAHKEKKGHI